MKETSRPNRVPVRRDRPPYKRPLSDACRAAAAVMRHWIEDGLQPRRPPKKNRPPPPPTGPAPSDAVAPPPPPASLDRVSDLHE